MYFRTYEKRWLLSLLFGLVQVEPFDRRIHTDSGSSNTLWDCFCCNWRENIARLLTFSVALANTTPTSSHFFFADRLEQYLPATAVCPVHGSPASHSQKNSTTHGGGILLGRAIPRWFTSGGLGSKVKDEVNANRTNNSIYFKIFAQIITPDWPNY